MLNQPARIALLLTLFTLLYNVGEAVFAISFGISDHSLALLGFGLDSMIEIAAALVVLSLLFRRLRTDTQSVRLIGLSFLALSTFLTIDATRVLVTHDDPGTSTAGLVIAAVSLVIMPGLAVAKYQIGSRMNSHALQAEAKETAVCALLSLALLVGLATHALAGIWWADPITALAMAAVAHERVCWPFADMRCAARCRPWTSPFSTAQHCASAARGVSATR